LLVTLIKGYENGAERISDTLTNHGGPVMTNPGIAFNKKLIFFLENNVLVKTECLQIIYQLYFIGKYSKMNIFLFVYEVLA